jgi:hypothetical protein
MSKNIILVTRNICFLHDVEELKGSAYWLECHAVWSLADVSDKPIASKFRLEKAECPQISHGCVSLVASLSSLST